MSIDYLAIIPARGGSKGIPRKNLEPIGGIPLIQHTIHSARASCRLSHTILNTDDEEVAQAGREAGVDVPFLRPAELAEDKTPMRLVVRHTLEWWKAQHGEFPQQVVVLAPTSPFRTGADVDAAIEAYETSGKDSLVSVCEVSQHPSECVSLDANERVEFVQIDDTPLENRQSYKTFYFIDGAIYIRNVEAFLKEEVFFDTSTHLFLMPKLHSIDINDFSELTLARAIHRYKEEVDPQALDR